MNITVSGMKTEVNTYMKCYTIGHSLHEPERFLELLLTHSVNCVADVRSSPFSARAPQFNRDMIGKYLSAKGILYVYMGSQLGARHDDPSMLDEGGMVKYSALCGSGFFRDGLNRIIDGIKKNYTIAIMCSEKDPLQCHRFALVSRQLNLAGVSVLHILEDGTTVTQESLEEIILQKYAGNYEQMSLFGGNISREEALEQAMIEYWKKIAYRSVVTEYSE